jgi:hypothetical protein
MSIWTSGGKLVVDSSKKPINCNDCPCNEASCDQECCNDGKWPDQINCDLGVLGWADGDCDVCDTIGGVYVLTYDAVNSTPAYNCIWRYAGPELCSFVIEPCGQTAYADLRITATLSPTCNWQVSVVFRVYGTSDACQDPSKTATYNVTNSGGEDCDGVSLTLTTEDSADTEACIGSFLATIELSR